MSDEIARKLAVIGTEIDKVVFWPTGSSPDNFRFDVAQRNHSLFFKHNGLEVNVDNFHLIDRERWDEDPRHRMYPAVSRSGAGELWYQATVEWQAEGQKGKADNVALGYPLDRSRALSGLTPNTPARTVIEDLLIAIESVASSIYEGDLLGRQPPSKEPKFSEDNISRVREKIF